MTRRSWLLVGALVAVQAALVWGVFVAAPHPGGDNAGYVALGHALASGQGYTELWDPARPPHTKYPPVFPLLLALAMALGADGWGGLKVVSFLATLVVSPAVFLWARSRLPEGLSFGVALLVALSPSLLYHSHWVLSDVPFLAFTVLALWALSTALGESPRGTSIEAVERRGDEGGTGVVPAGPPRREGGGPWLWAGAVACLLLACFTRTAGLPLAVAGVGVLLFRRRWLAAGGVATALGVPLLLWWARGRAQAAGQGRYASEFFLLDPYQPDLGPAGAGDFVARVLDNLGAYGTRFVPEALLGSQGAGAALVGLVVVALAVSGWVRCLRRGPGVAELFLPLYAGLILVWPPVWSGDRFALPLVPILLVLAAGEAWRLTRRTGEGVRVGVLMALA
ncbi:MAG: glycosyltransferase family 39 protein, partial [Gemmatimonadota bacterium]